MRGKRLLGLIVAPAAILVSLASAAEAQDTTPSMQFVSAPLLTHGEASTFYGSGTTHTVSLAGPTEFSQRAPEIKELARGSRTPPT